MSRAATDTLEKVSSEFEAEVLSDLEGGRAQALATLESAKKEASEQVSKALETNVKQAESLKRQIIGAAELGTRNAQLKSLEKEVTAVFDLAVKEVTALSGPSAEKSLASLIREGLERIGPRAKVQCAQKDRRGVASALRKLNGGQVRLTLSEDSIETIGGIVLSNADGTVKFDNTFESRLERMRPALRKEVAGILTSS